MRQRPLLTAVLGVVGLLVLGGAIFTFSFWRSGHSLEVRMGTAVKDLEEGRWSEARSSLDLLATEAQAFSSRLGGPFASVVSRLPVAGRSVRTARALADATGIAATSAGRALPVLEGEDFWRSGRVNLEALSRLRAVADAERPKLLEAVAVVRRSPAKLIPPSLAHSRGTALERLGSAIHGLDVAVKAVDLSGRVLGAAGARKYFIIFENPTEMRGAGGLWGNYGVLEAKDGALGLGRFGRLHDDLGEFATTPGPAWFEARYGRFGARSDWRQLPVAPDFPTVVAMAEADVLNVEEIGFVDGTIGIDPVGIAALLKIGGPVRVPGWPDPVTADNVIETTLHDAYSYFETNQERIAFLGDTALAAWQQLVHGDISLRKIAGSGLGAAVEGKHLRMHFVRPEEQKLAKALNAEGDLGDGSRTFGLVTQNIAGNKMDFWLKRGLDIELSLQPNGSAHGTATIRLKNDGPASGEPRYMIGPFDERFKAGDNVQFVRLYLPGGTTVTAPHGSGAVLGLEEGFVVVEWNVTIPAGGHVERSISFDRDNLWDPEAGSVDLKIRKQQFLAPDNVHIILDPPWGRRLKLEPDPTCKDGEAVQDVELVASVKSWLPGWLIGPWARHADCGKTVDLK